MLDSKRLKPDDRWFQLMTMRLYCFVVDCRWSAGSEFHLLAAYWKIQKSVLKNNGEYVADVCSKCLNIGLLWKYKRDVKECNEKPKSRYSHDFCKWKNLRNYERLESSLLAHLCFSWDADRRAPTNSIIGARKIHPILRTQKCVERYMIDQSANDVRHRCGKHKSIPDFTRRTDRYYESVWKTKTNFHFERWLHFTSEECCAAAANIFSKIPNCLFKHDC